MKQSLQLKLGQQLTMTPQLQQAIRLLQLSTLDLQAEIQEALDANPMLEIPEEQENETPKNTENDNSSKEADSSESTSAAEKEEFEAEQSNDDTWNDDIPKDLAVDTNWDDVYQSAPSNTGLSRQDNDDFDFESRRTVDETLQDHLYWQLNLSNLSDKDRSIAEMIVDAVEPSGMLGQTIDDIFNDLHSKDEELELDEVIAVLRHVQQFDPPGVAAQDVRECLLLQLRQLKYCEDVRCAQALIEQHLELLGARDFKQIMRKMKVKEEQLRDAIQIIQTLNPHPGEQVNRDTTEYVVPDVFVAKTNNRWTVQLNPEIAPKIRINSDYASLVKRADSSSDNTFLRDNLQEARWFLKSLQSRNETLLKVATCIVERQQGFLDHGPEAMKPMVLHDVAEMVDMHESTISRVTTQKYMHTPQGIFELKYFFSSHVATDSGGECSSTAIRAIIKKLIAAENSRKPLSDSKITGLLEEQGIKVARRTIAKYRESLGIPPSNERKQLI